MDQFKDFVIPIGLTVWLLLEVYKLRTGKTKDLENKLDKLIDAVMQNTLANTALKIEMENLKAMIQLLPKLASDMNIAHEKIRRIEKEIEQ